MKIVELFGGRTVVDPAIYNAAVEVLERRGWGKGWFYVADDAPTNEEIDNDDGEFLDNVFGTDDGECPVCLVGALNVALFGKASPEETGDTMRIRGAYIRHLAELLDADSLSGVPDWNDTIAESVEDVKAVLRRAAEQAA